nr:unnamed protein product [Spirometra erinaceieuropaei]
MFFLILLSSIAFVLGEDDGTQNSWPKTLRTFLLSSDDIDICSMPLDKGPCNGSLIRYGYDSRTGECKKFTFGGCDGNDNVFLTRTDCERATARCSSNVPLDICNMPIERGRCRASIDRYGYDKETGECKEFSFGGCGGNENNFSTQKECDRAASRCLNKGTPGVVSVGKPAGSRDDLQQVNTDKAAGNRTNEPLDRQHCVVVQGLSESNAPTPKERIPADLDMLQHLLNKMLNSNEGVTIHAAIRIEKKADPDSGTCLLESIKEIASRPDVVLMGDFIAPCIQWSDMRAKCSMMAFDYRLLKTTLEALLPQRVLSPTRAREATG